MYGTLVKFEPIPGKEQDLLERSRAWAKANGDRVGFVAEFLMTPDSAPGELHGLVIFESRSQYWQNARSPEQDATYRAMRALLRSDPEWLDGKIEAVQPQSVPM